jgi:A/G-specific adenine glycosylase
MPLSQPQRKNEPASLKRAEKPPSIEPDRLERGFPTRLDHQRRRHGFGKTPSEVRLTGRRAANPRSEQSRPEAALVGALVHWFTGHARDLPWRHTRDPYAIWISEMMLQQTQVKTVLSYWTRWMGQWPNVRALAQARLEQVLKSWEGLGYYRRARHLHQAAQIIATSHDGRFPRDFAVVLALPGVGRYTAGAVCSLAFNLPEPVVDGNVTRVLTRVFGIRQNPKERGAAEHLWGLAAALAREAKALPRRRLPYATAGNCSALNQSLMELGAVLCLPRKPLCAACPISGFCVARQRGWQERLPNLIRRPGTEPRAFAALAVSSAGRYLVRQRPAGGVNGLLWEFPNFELKSGRLASPQSVMHSAVAKAVRRWAGRQLRLKLRSLVPLCEIRHSITRFRITVLAFRAALAPGAQADRPEGQWLTPRQLNHLPFAAAHRRILQRLSDKAESTGPNRGRTPPVVPGAARRALTP